MLAPNLGASIYILTSEIAKVWNFLEKHFEEILAGTLVMFMASMVFFQVVMRYLFNMPTSWSDELAIYAMLWSVYISVAWAVRERAHIRVMNFCQLLPTKVAVGMTVFSDLIWFLVRHFSYLSKCFVGSLFLER